MINDARLCHPHIAHLSTSSDRSPAVRRPPRASKFLIPAALRSHSHRRRLAHHHYPQPPVAAIVHVQTCTGCLIIKWKTTNGDERKKCHMHVVHFKPYTITFLCIPPHQVQVLHSSQDASAFNMHSSHVRWLDGVPRLTVYTLFRARIVDIFIRANTDRSRP